MNWRSRCRSCPRKGNNVPPWLVDRILRNLLVDLTGNTHRAEFCIDKLYSPDSPTGRLGLVELRGFEMPPHARMSLVQQLLIRALVAWFWRQPYTQPLVPWGTQLHDRWMLPRQLAGPAFGAQGSARRGLSPSRTSGLPRSSNSAFRVTACCATRVSRSSCGMRSNAWPVLGEEPGGGGTSRFVDSSIERVQIMATGLTPGRHAVTVGGRELPLRALGVQGQYVAGLRYRAWQPASCLHPTIGVQTPLMFDLYDRWSGRAVAGCTYHVAHPAGAMYDSYPVNAFEAEARRIARFQPWGHSAGPYRLYPERRIRIFRARWTCVCQHPGFEFYGLSRVARRSKRIATGSCTAMTPPRIDSGVTPNSLCRSTSSPRARSC